MKRLLSVILCVALLLSLCTVTAFGLVLNPKFSVDEKSVSSLSKAFSLAADYGSVIRQEALDETVYSTCEEIYVKKDVTLICGKNFGNTFRRIEFSGGFNPLFTVCNEGKLTLRYAEIMLSDSEIVGNGKLILVERGGTLVLDGTDTEPVTFLDSRESSGLILVKSGAVVLLYGAEFKGNQSDDAIKVEDGGAVIGDISGDRNTDLADLIRVKKHLASPESFPVSCSLDFNLDGNTNATDLTVLIKYLLSI